MNGRHDDRAVDYLLDQMPESERDAFEDEYFGDEDAYGALLAAEDDLFDRYCEGSLTEAQRARFEQRYLTTEEGRDRVAFARALKRRSVESGQPATAAQARVRPVTMARWLPWAAVVVAALGAVVFGTRQAADARVAREERAALQERLAQQQQRSRDQDRRLGELRQQTTRLQEQARAMEELLGAGAATGLRVAALALKSGLRRDAAVLPRLAVTPGLDVVRLQLQVQGPTRTAYRASLQTPEGRELWVRGGVAPVSLEGRPTVTFAVPAALLAPGHYVVMLGPSAQESDAEYVFEVRPGR